MNAQKMKAIVATGYGSPEVLQLQEVDKPTPSPTQVLVKVEATSVTTADGMMRTGTPYIGRLFIGLTKPKKPIPGTGFAGVVESVGNEVTQYKAGDRVFGETKMNFCANAEYLVAEEAGVMLHMPESMKYQEAAVYCDGHLTSINFLKELAQVKPGQKVLINGASGSLGTSAVQLAKYFGAHVTGVCSTTNVGLVKSLGADAVIDYKTTDFTKSENKYDIIYDTIGKSSFGACKETLAEEGQYITPVLKLSVLGEMILSSIKGKKRVKFEATGSRKADYLRNLLQELVEIFKSGQLQTIIDRQYPLSKVAEAHQYIGEGHKKGNVIAFN